jgi:putative peptidoglycan lipid II flippase
MPQQTSSSLRLAAGLIGGAVLSKLVGIVREIIQARLLGASVMADSFRGALGVTVTPIFPLQGDVIGSVLIPLHREWKSRGVATCLFSSLVVSFLVLTTVIAVVVWVFADPLTDFLVPGFGPEAHRTTVGLVRILTLFMPAYVLSTVISSAEIALGRPRSATLRASAQNIGLIGGILVMYVTHDSSAMAIGVVIGVNAVAIYGGVMLWYDNEIAVRHIRLSSIWSAVTIFLRRMRGLYGQPLAEQVTLVAERLLASMAAVGTLASVDYARTFTDTALLLIGQPLGYVVLARAGPAQQDMPRQVMAFAGPLLGVGIPVSLSLVVFAPDLVRVVLARGAFDEHAVTLTADALRGISAGLCAATLAWVLVRMLIASDRRVVAGRIITTAYFANIFVDLALTPHFGSLGLGLGEGTRGVILLSGALLALRAYRGVAVLLMHMLPFAAVLLVADLSVLSYFDRPIVRLILASIALTCTVAAWFLIVAPDVPRALLRRTGMLRDRFNRVGFRKRQEEAPPAPDSDYGTAGRSLDSPANVR